MSIIINNKNLSEESISNIVRAVIKLIPHAELWLKKMLLTDVHKLEFSSEDEIIHALIKGLHDTQLVYLYALGCYVHPEKLLQIPLEDLIKLADSNVALEQCEEQRVMWDKFGKSYNLYGASIWYEVEEFIESCGLTRGTFVHGASTEDVIEFYKAIHNSYELNNIQYGKNYKKHIKEAVSFAVVKSTTLLGFSNLMRFYMYITNHYSLNKCEPRIRAIKVEEIYSKISIIAEPLITCPKISVPMNPINLFSTIQHCVSHSCVIGFQDLSSAVYQLSQGLDHYGEPEVVKDQLVADFSLLEQQLNRYFKDIQSYISNTAARTQSLSQTGCYWQYLVESEDKRTVLRLDEKGELTLQAHEQTWNLDNRSINNKIVEDLIEVSEEEI